LQASKEFVPFNFSSSGKASGGVVFAGYGITAPEYNYDDYAGLDVHGKFVIVLEHEPQEFDPSSVFEGKVYTDHAQFYSKAANARSHGARGVILIEDRVHHKTDPEQLEAFGRAEGPANAGILFVQVKEAILTPWFRAAGKDLPAVESEIDRNLKPDSFPIPGVNVRESVDIDRAVRTAHNVAGYLRGDSDEYLVIGAHYDHLGLGGQYSLAPSLAGTVHPGADDNASGTAGVLELARYFSAHGKPKRGILFITFAGEELGLLGSGYYANHPELPIQNAVTMINMDMIGRVRDGKIYVGGAGTGTTLRKDLEAWRGVAFTDADFEGPNAFNTKKLLGAPCTLSITHTTKNDGSIYAKISSIGKVMKGVQVPALVNQKTYLALVKNEFDPLVFAALSDKMKGIIAASPEYHELSADAERHDDPGSGPREFAPLDDDIPF